MVKKFFNIFLLFLIINCSNDIIPIKKQQIPMGLMFLGGVSTIDKTVYQPKMIVEVDNFALLNGVIKKIDGEVGKKTTIGLFIKNDGNDILIIKELKEIEGDSSIKITKYPTKAIFEPNEKDYFEITYEPIIYGTKTKAFAFYMNSSEDSFIFTISGTAQPPPSPEIQIIPDKIDTISHIFTSNSSITLSWQKTTNAEKYLIYSADPPPGVSKTLIGETTNTSFVVNSLKQDTNNYYSIRPQSSTGVLGDFSNTHLVYVPPIPPVIPGKVTSIFHTLGSNDSVNLSWNSTINAIKYLIYNADPPPGISKTYIGETNLTNFTINNLKQDTNNYYSVRSQSSTGVLSDYSDVHLVYVPEIPPVTPGLINNISHTILNNGNVIVTWDAATDANSYLVFKTEPPPSTSQATIAEIFTNSIILTGLKEDTTQWYRIRAKTSAGVGGQFSVYYKITIPPQYFPEASKPNNFQIVTSTSSGIPIQLTFLWQASTNATYYKIYRSENNPPAINDSNLFGIVLSNNLVYLIQNEDRGKTYYFKVIPHNAIEVPGIASDIGSVLIPRVLRGYNNVTWKIPVGYNNVTWENHTGYDVVTYQELDGFNISYEYRNGFNITFRTWGVKNRTRNCRGTIGVPDRTWHCHVPATDEQVCGPHTPPGYTFNGTRHLQGNVWWECYYSCYYDKNVTVIEENCPGDASNEISGTDNYDYINQQTIYSLNSNSYSGHPHSQDAATQVWTYANPYISFENINFHRAQVGGQYRNYSEIPVWNSKNSANINLSQYNILIARSIVSEITIRNINFAQKSYTAVGPQGFKTNAEYNTLVAQQGVELIRNLTGTLSLQSIGNQGYRTVDEMRDLRLQVFIKNIYDLYEGEPVYE